MEEKMKLEDLSVEAQEFQKLFNSPQVQKFVRNPYFLKIIEGHPTRKMSVTLTCGTGSIHKFKAWVNGGMVIATSHGTKGEWHGTVFGGIITLHIRVWGIDNATFNLEVNGIQRQLQLKGGQYENVFNY